MRILVITNLYPPDVVGGYELGCRQAVDALRGLGHEVRVLTSAPRCVASPEPHVSRSMRLIDSWSDYRFRKNAPVTNYLEQSQSLRVDSFNIHALLSEIENFKPDVAYVWMLVGLGGLGLMATLQHQAVPWVWHLMDDVPLMLCRLQGRVVSTFATEFNRRLVGSYIACSRALADEIEMGGVELRDRVSILPNWVAGPRKASRKQFLRDGMLRIVSAAGLIDRQVDKGIDVLIESAARLRTMGHENFIVDIFGRCTDDFAPHLIHKFGLESHVLLRGNLSQSELSDRFAESDVFAFPTRSREPFGFAPLEAAARGCVPLISQTCGLAEWFVHGVHLLKARRSPQDFANQFAAILDGSIDLSPMSGRTAEIIAHEYTIESIAPRIVEVLTQEAIRPRSRAGSAAEAYQLAVLAERLSSVLIQETLCA